jgi:hypothetical protein
LRNTKKPVAVRWADCFILMLMLGCMINIQCTQGDDMTVDPVMMNIFMAVITVLILGIAGKIAWNWLMSGRMKSGEYYMTTQACETCRQNCCVNSLKVKLAEHIQNETGADSRVDQRLANIEERMQEARRDTAEMRKEVSGIRSALDTMAGLFEGYIKRSDARKDNMQ